MAKKYIKTDEGAPDHFGNLIKDGGQKGYFKIEGDKITYPAQSFTDDFSDLEEKVRAGLFYDLIEKYGYRNQKNIIDLEFNRTIGHPYKTNKSQLCPVTFLHINRLLRYNRHPQYHIDRLHP
ncbi:MAG: hypothetical protein C0392_02785, partial [Syntrophus sp. (in: bacteria)]|nr:hypothetical protein [Syntrophus sp. (in: bacteria)]